MRKTITIVLMLVVALLGFSTYAQAPQTGVYRIQNVGGNNYIKVTGKYDAQLVTSQSAASYITVGIEKKLSDGTYKVNSLASNYGAENTPVEVYDYIPKALKLAEAELRKVLANSSEEHVQMAINRMHELAEQYAFMRIMPVDGKADTYHAIAVLPYIPKDIVDVWEQKVKIPENYEGDMWQWCKDLVVSYLSKGGTDTGLTAKILNNLQYIHEGCTYMLTEDTDGSFGYIETGENIKDEETYETTVNTATLKSNNEHSYWKLIPKVNTDNVQDGTYKIHNLGGEDGGKDRWVRIQGRYYATPDGSEEQASDIRITFDGKANGGQKIINLQGKDPNNNDIDIYNYVQKAIFIGKVAISNVLDGNADPDNIVIAQDTLENFVNRNAFMCIKPVKDVEDVEDAVYAYATIPHIPGEVIYQMAQHGAITEQTEKAAWEYGVNYVKKYLHGELPGISGTDNTLSSYILANIDMIRPGVTYYLGAESNGTFDYYPKFAEGEGWNINSEVIVDNFNDIKTNKDYMWGFDVKDVEEDNLTSGTYKVRNVETGDYVQVLSKYYARPNTNEAGATEIHITYNGKLDDGSYKVTNMSAVAKNGEQADIQSYVEKAIKLGKVAIADVLNGMSSPANIEKAKKYMEDFVRAAAYMRVKPVTGTNYVYAIATIPEIPYDVYHEMSTHGIITADTKEAAWDYGVQVVQNYLANHNTDGTLAQLINNLINDPGIIQGHTYYLKEDSNRTFGYVDAENFSSTDKSIQWGIDLEEEDQPVESDFYKICNVATGKYVEVVGPYYATPSATEAEATPIAVTIDGMLEDGSMKVTNLVGDGRNIQSYVDHAIELGKALIDRLIGTQSPNPSSPENVTRAKEAMESFIHENAYMRVKLVPGETDAYYAYVTLPTVPDSIVTEWEKKYPNYTSQHNGGHTMRDWAVEQVLDYLDTHGTNSTLAAMVRNNIDRLYEGHTYYLRDDADGTFGFGDFSEGEVTLTDQHYWWGFADAIKAEPFSGYYRIKGADGKYVNVTGKFAATPDASATEAKTAAGTVIYIGTGETNNTKTLPLEMLRSQGVDVGDYMTMINDVLAVVAATASDVVTEKLNEDPNYQQYAGLVEPMVQTLLESVDLNLYVEPTLTSDGKDAYMLEVSIPDLKEYCDMALDMLSLMGKSKEQLVAKLQTMEQQAGPSTTMGKLYNIAWRTAQYLDDPDEMWDKLKENAKPYIQSYFVDGNGNTGGVGLSPTLGNLILNSIDRIDYGETYALRQDADGSFGFDNKNNLANDDAGKWILEPFDEQDPNYDETTYMPFVANTKFEQESYDKEGKPTGDTYNYTTTYLDFEAKIETTNAAAYTISETERKSFTKKDGTTIAYYLAKLEPVGGTTIPAATPVVLRSDSDGEIVLRPTGKPEHPAVETSELSQMAQFVQDLLNEKLGRTSTSGAPALRTISQPTDDNKLVGSFLGDDVPSGMENSYLKLGQKENPNGGLDMNGLGFWKSNVSTLEGNNAYLLGYDKETETGLTDFIYDTDFDAGKDGDAPGYIFEYEDDTFTAVNNVSTTKEVKSIRYYNALGIESETPFEGVNIIVTTFTDGSQATTKAIK